MSAKRTTERFTPEQVTGLPFDEIMRRALLVKPDKPKKGSKPKSKGKR